VQISEVVNGEELEGYVLRAEGHIIPVNGTPARGIVSVYRTSQEGVGSFNCSKQ
jgi:aspartate 1-decarboxylase